MNSECIHHPYNPCSGYDSDQYKDKPLQIFLFKMLPQYELFHKYVYYTFLFSIQQLIFLLFNGALNLKPFILHHQPLFLIILHKLKIPKPNITSDLQKQNEI